MDLRIAGTQHVRPADIYPTREVSQNADFSFTLNKLDEEGLTERLRALIGDITETGKSLAEHMDLRDMKRYRSLVSDFINEVVTHSHKFSRENFLDRRGRHRVYGIVRLVDKNLDELAQELLKSEKDHLKILEKTDEIKGLLLDILI
jgi:uncharacterized protein YaaR (DUF327 family)